MSRQLVARNSTLMFAAQLIGRGAGLVVFATLARFLTVEAFGVFGYATAMVGFLTIAVDFGYDMVVTREAARGSGTLGAGLALRLKTAHFLVGYPTLLAVAALQSGTGAGLTAVAILGAAAWHEAANRTVSAWYLAQGRAEYGLVSEWAMSLLRLLMVSAVLLAGARLVGVAAAYWAASALTVLGMGCWAWQRGFRPSFAVRAIEEKRRMFGEAAAFAAYGLLFTLSFRLDIVLLKSLRPDAEVGLYFAAFRVTEAMLVLPAALTGALYPVLARLDGTGDRAGFARACAEATRGLAVAGLGVALVMGGAAPLVIRVVAGSGYEAAVEYLRWLLLCFALTCVHCVGFVALNSVGRQWSSTRVMLTGAAVKVAWNLAFVPTYGAIAACLGSVVTSAVITAHVAVNVRDAYPVVSWLKSVAGSVGAAVAAFVVWSATPALSDGWRVAAMLGVFLAGALLTGAVRRDDLQVIRNLAPGRSSGAMVGDR